MSLYKAIIYISTICWFIGNSTLLHGQEHEWGIEVRQKVGFLAAHRGTIAHVPNRIGLPLEIAWYRKPAGN